MKIPMLSILLLVASAGCGGQEPDPQPTTTAPSPATLTDKPTGAAAQTNVAKIVFVGQKQACPCTRNRVDETWKTLQGVLAKGHSIPVEKIQLDVDAQRYDELDDLGSLVVAPGIYLLDGGGKLVELLQGEVEDYTIAEALRGGGHR